MFDRFRKLISKKHLATGEAGERAAERFLKKEKGFRIISRNWRHGRDEIDLIGYDLDILVFIEVKTRRGGARVPGYYSVDNRKKNAVKRAARAYLRTLKKPPLTHRLDVVEVNHHPDEAWEILHFANIEW